jgi:uncharacterized protein YegJ (DUF2314 family)
MERNTMVQYARCALLFWVFVSLSTVANGFPSEEREEEPNVYIVGAEDVAMNLAMATARATIGEFLQRLNDPPKGQSHLTLKVMLEEDEVVEHVWLETLSHDDGEFSGIVANEVRFLSNVSLGDRVVFPVSQVSDWMAVEDGRLVGGYTLRAIRENMTADERRAFDDAYSLIID